MLRSKLVLALSAVTLSSAVALNSEALSSNTLSNTGFKTDSNTGLKTGFNMGSNIESNTGVNGDTQAEARTNNAYISALYNKAAQGDTEAFNDLTKAAANGDVIAQVSLGSLYLSGQGVAVDYAQAYKWMLAAANQGNA